MQSAKRDAQMLEGPSGKSMAKVMLLSMIVVGYILSPNLQAFDVAF